MNTNTNVTASSGYLDRIVRGILKWRIRKAMEKAEYWRGKALMWRASCQVRHSSYERVHLAEAMGKWLLYDQRAKSLSANAAGQKSLAVAEPPFES